MLMMMMMMMMMTMTMTMTMIMIIIIVIVLEVILAILIIITIRQYIYIRIRFLNCCVYYLPSQFLYLALFARKRYPPFGSCVIFLHFVICLSCLQTSGYK